jgi:hypothetical protein
MTSSRTHTIIIVDGQGDQPPTDMSEIEMSKRVTQVENVEVKTAGQNE